MLIWMTGATTVRDANGIMIPDLLENLNNSMPDLISEPVGIISSTIANFVPNIIGSGSNIGLKDLNFYTKPACLTVYSCEYGLMNYFQV